MVCMVFVMFWNCTCLVSALHYLWETHCTAWPDGRHIVSLMYCMVIALQNTWETRFIEWRDGTNSVTLV